MTGLNGSGGTLTTINTADEIIDVVSALIYISIRILYTISAQFRRIHFYVSASDEDALAIIAFKRDSRLSIRIVSDNHRNAIFVNAFEVIFGACVVQFIFRRQLRPCIFDSNRPAIIHTHGPSGNVRVVGSPIGNHAA